MKSLAVAVMFLALALPLAGCGGGDGHTLPGSQIVKRIKTSQGYSYTSISSSRHGSIYCVEQRVSGHWEHFANATVQATAHPGRCPKLPGVS